MQMRQNFKQIIYNNANSAHNYPRNLTATSLIDGTAFEQYMPLTQLGVRALPGTKLYINGNNTPIIIGFIGMFEIDLTNGGLISSLSFDKKSIDEIQRNDNSYLVVDMAFLGGGD